MHRSGLSVGIGRTLARAARATAVAAAVAVVLTSASPVVAQPGGGQGRGGPGGGFGGGFGGMGGFGPTIASRDLDRYADFLRLSPEQREMSRLLFEGYTEQTRQLGNTLRQQMERVREQFRENRDPSAWQGIQSSMEEMRASRVKIETGFLEDFKAILSDDQRAKWPELERSMRRDRLLPRGLMSGERLDVIRLVDEADLPPVVRAEAELVLEQYTLALDRALVRRQEVQEDAMRQAGELFRSGDMDQAQGLLEKARSASTEVRDLNRKYARQIEALLPDDHRGSWQAAVKRASFPQIYRPSMAARSFEAAAGFADLDETQKDALAAMRASYERDVSSVNDRLAAAQEESEGAITVREIMRRGRGGAEEGPMGELRRERRDLDRSALDNLRKLLRPEQIERLPQNDREGRPDRGGDRGRFMDGAGERRRQIG